MDTEIKERPHHPTSPSTLESLEACPCYKSRQPKKLHERTIAGTRSHGAAEKETDDERISDEDSAAVAQCLEHVAMRKQQLIEEAVEARYKRDEPQNPAHPADFEMQVLDINECYLRIDDRIYDDGTVATTAGYLDKLLLSWDQKKAVILDYKYGIWPVTHAEENLQGIAYALGVFHHYPKVQEVYVDFLQPHVTERPITYSKIARQEIPMHYARVCATVARAREARAKGDFSMAAPYSPVCGFCEHLGKCDKALNLFLQIGKKFHPLEMPDSITPTQIMDPNQTKLALQLASIVSVWAKAFKSVLSDRVLRGDAPVPIGFSLQTTEKRELVDLKKYREAALDYITAAEFASTLDTTFGAVEGLIAEKAPRGQKQAWVEKFKKQVEELGAVVKQPPFTFLKARPSVKSDENAENTNIQK